MTSDPASAPARTLRALLVGIDAYREPVPALRGCVADVERVASLLEVRAAAAGDVADILFLRDGEATRDAVIEAFRSHLGQAGPDETALFYYSGHGSQETALPEHLPLEPDGLNETLVLVDSRDPGRFDLADKELAVLVGEVADAAGHTLIVLDCCHSGSGLRAATEDGTRVRRAPTDRRVRSLESYLRASAGGERGTRLTEGGGVGARPTGEEGVGTGPGQADEALGRPTEADWLGTEPRGGYVLLAACRSDQTAKEITVDGVDRGAFSVALQRALAGTGGKPSYLDLQRWIAAAVRNLAADQSPVLEAPRADAVSLPFLGGVAAPRVPVLTASFVRRRGWVLDAGRLHGLDAEAGAGGSSSVDLYPLTADGEPLTSARIGDVSVTTSLLEPADEAVLDRAATYRAVVTSAGQPRTPVAVRGEGAAAAAVREALARSSVVRPAQEEQGDLVVDCSDEDIRVSRPDSSRPLAALEPAGEVAAVERVVRTCEHIGRWLGIAHRANPTSALASGQVTLTVYDQAGDPVVGADGGVQVEYAPGEELGPVIKIEFANRSDVPLHCAVLALSELYGVECLTPGGAVLLQPGQSGWVTDDQDLPRVRTFVPEGQDRTTDRLKLLASTEPFDAQALAQEELRPPTLRRGAEAGAARERGFSKVTMPAAGQDWTTRDLLVTTVRPGRWTAVGRADQRQVAPGVAVIGHPDLSAKVRLSSRHNATRGAVVPLLPPALLESDALTEPFSLSATRAVGEDLTVLELDDVDHAETVTQEHPLTLRVARPLGDGELVLPLGFDGQDYLPLGRAMAHGNETDILLERLPVQTELARRSLGGSLKILFRKLVLRRLGAGYEHPLLSAVTFDDGKPSYVHDAAAVAAAVRDAQRVLLVVHGIIGDTRGMVAALSSGDDPVAAGYDAVLALDYENINTPVTQTAQALAERIAAVGLAQGQRVDVVAHSMGGLVSRWWIEREGGSAAVRRLMTFGTPHAGSPWPRVQDVATAGLALAANGLGGLLGATLGFLVRGLERVDDALDGMMPGSQVLADLARSPAATGVRYVAVAGDEPFGAGADAGRAMRILRKLRLPDAALGMVFAGLDHDVAVSVASATSVGRSWATPPAVLDADCNHMGYFSSAAGMAALRKALEV